jgi:hypothetical protein
MSFFAWQPGKSAQRIVANGSSKVSPLKHHALAVALLAGAGLAPMPVASAAGEESAKGLTLQLTSEQSKVYEAYRQRKDRFDRRLQAYWSVADVKRETRRSKHRARQAYTLDDYVAEQPPKWSGVPHA